MSVKKPHFHPLISGFIAHPDGNGGTVLHKYQANPAVLAFCECVADQLHRHLKIVRKQPIRDNLTLKQRESIEVIRDNMELVLTEADKGKGWVAMQANEYEEMGLRMLRLSHIECEEGERDILNMIQQKLADVLADNDELLQRWKLSSADLWREKYFSASLHRNPQTQQAFRLSNYRELPKLSKPDSRGITGAHVAPTQPYALYFDIALTPVVQTLPHFLKDCDELTRQLTDIKVEPTDVFATADVVRLYPSINIEKCVEFLCQFLQERITAGDPTVDMDCDSLKLFHDMIEVILNGSYCRFASRTFKAVKGFPTGLACGRTCAEIYLHVIERDLWARFRGSMTFAKRYIDDFNGFFRDESTARAFIAEYGNLSDDVQITADVSSDSFVMLDTRASKGEQWRATGSLDLALYQKPDSAFLYIPMFSDHPEHVLQAFIHGECIRIVKRNSCEVLFGQHRELFRYRLLARGYSQKFIGTAFATVRYSDRYKFLFERHDAAQRKSPMALTAENKTPALIALSLQHSQRANALGIARAIF